LMIVAFVFRELIVITFPY